MTLQRFVLGIACLTLCVVVAGCQPGAKQQPAGTTGSAEAETSDDSGQQRIQEALAKLSPEDRSLAEKQKICPVSGEPLGSMGAPIKVRVQDRDVFICCSGCEEELKKKPDEYLAKLPQP